ncbi:hypothetical protein MHYP_G00335330 [Metynnis hypsauchen]
MDQMVRKYTVRSGTRRWPVAVFYNLIDISALNAHVLFQACTGVKERRSDFLVKLARELAQSHMAAKEVHMWQMQKGDVVAVPDEETSPPPEKRGRMETHEWLTETAKDGTVWREEQIGRPLHHSPIECNPMDGEPTAFARRKVSSRLQSFLCFISLQMLRTIQEWTVQHARQTQHGNWFMDLPELMAFITILILRGIVRLPAVHDAWSATLGVPSISKIMARNRFQDLHLRFDDKDTRSERVANDQFAAVSDVWGSFVANCIASYNPGRHITIDEQLFPTKTRCCFLHYIATKPDKFGIKFWVACDLKSKYVCNIIPYLVTSKTIARPEDHTPWHNKQDSP